MKKEHVSKENALAIFQDDVLFIIDLLRKRDIIGTI